MVGIYYSIYVVLDRSIATVNSYPTILVTSDILLAFICHLRYNITFRLKELYYTKH
jgi:hypothetical protein